jgi:hypothetical protein
MNYKSSFHPTLILCPETANYVPLEQVREKLSAFGYARFSDADANNLPVVTPNKAYQALVTLAGSTLPLGEAVAFMDDALASKTTKSVCSLLSYAGDLCCSSLALVVDQ